LALFRYGNRPLISTFHHSQARSELMATELTWLGHGSWAIETGGHRLLLDPFLNDSPTAPIKADQAQADFLLISHGHFDHVADAAAIAKRTGATVVANFEICEWLGKQGVEKVEPMNTGGAIKLPFGRVKMTPAHHSSVLPDGTYAGNPVGFLLTLEGRKIYFACDTSLFLDMQLIGAAGLDLAVLPIGDRFTMGPDDAVEATKLLRPKRVAPAHYNTWPPIEQDASAWAERIQAETEAEPVVLEPGGSLSL
jgi:L-ascorbate metabolism protein UlaG (beta-lactamase superfamily)